MIFSCNQSYVISLPLFLHQSFSLSERYAGILLGTSAGIEVAVMFLTSFLLKRISIFMLLTVSLASAVILYGGFWLSSSYSSLLLLQVFNSICTGIAISLGAIWFQNMLPNYTGIASTLFTNCISAGVIFGAIIVGATNYLDGYRDVYLINSILMSGSLGIFCLFCREEKVSKDDARIRRNPEPLMQNVGIRSESTTLG
jgi:SET family sugar efflux transporter-like MFS transporter